jgi:dolichol-phosphate mannosyltransferase
MKKKIIIFTATYNESANIVKLIESIESLNLNLSLLIVDDNSPDNTGNIIQNYSSNKIKIKLIKRPKKLGLDTAHKIAYDYALENRYDYLVTMDADLSHDPIVIPEFIKNLSKHKFVIGSRYIKGGMCKMSWSRLFLSFYGNKFIKFVSGIESSEFTTSYRGFNLVGLKNFELKMVKSKGYSFFMETIFLLHKRNIIIKEIPITFLDRQYGKSKISKLELFRTLFNLFKIKFYDNAKL